MARKGSGGFLAGLVLGGAVGAALALILAPRRDAEELLPFGDAGLAEVDPTVLLQRGQQAIRERLQRATEDAQATMNQTEERLRAEYRQAQVTD